MMYSGIIPSAAQGSGNQTQVGYEQGKYLTCCPITLVRGFFGFCYVCVGVQMCAVFKNS